jgi:hypothetical protein
MKATILTALAVGLGLVFFFHRRRLKAAILATGGIYLALTLARLIVLRDEVDRFAELGLVIGVLGAAWLTTNLFTHLLQSRRQRRAPRQRRL